MVVTRSQADADEVQARRDEEDLRQQRIEEERRRRLAQGPPASPSTQLGMGSGVGATIDAPLSAPRPKPGNLTRTGSPGRSVRSHRSTASAAARARLAELEAAEKLAELKKKELEIEADLIRKRLAADLTAIQEDQDSVHEEVPTETHNRRVDEWLQANPVVTRLEPEDSRTRSKEDRHLRFDLRDRSNTPTRTSRIDQLTEAMERLARPRIRCADLPTFSGAHGEWLTFKAAYIDSTKLYNISAIENLQRLRKSLTGEAREIVAALLATATDPEIILRTLGQSFGRPEVIIDKAFEDLKKLPRPGSSAVELNNFAIRVQNVVCVLQSIDQRGYLYNPALVREILSKLSPHVQARWCDYATDYGITAEAEIITLSRFLMREADRALKHAYVPASSATTQAKKETRPPPTPVIKKRTNAVFNVTESSENKEQSGQCPSCEQYHELPRCPQFKALTVEQRWDFAKEKRLCFKCLVKRHRRNLCRSKPCGVNQCHFAHHATLHYEKPKQDDKPPTTSSPTEAVHSVVTQTSTEPRAVLLKICPVTVVGPGGEMKTHALLDEGATISLIDADLAKKIGATGPPQRLLMRGVNMQQSEERSQLVTVKIKGLDNVPHELKARTVQSMQLHQQSIPVTLLNYEHLQDLERSEVCYESTRPGILVGTDHWEYIVSRELRLGERGQPVASRTDLGWVIHGTLPRSVIYWSENNVLHVFTSDHAENENERLHDLVDHHFKIDALGVSHKPKVSDAERRAVRIVESTIKRTSKGYEVGLPWKEDDVTLPPSYNSALRRLRKIEEKMDNDQDFAEAYTKQVDNLLQKGYATPCDGTEATSPVCWYLPHFAVQNPNKPGKQRLVFDAAAKSGGVSLNDHLLEGPDLLMSLQGIMFRFREKPIAITADIQEMFLQVKIRHEDQPAQQFLWRGSDRDTPPRHYKMTSMIFGAASSPFMAHYVRDANARAHADTHATALEAITRSHYMDDLAASYENEDEAQRAVSELMTVHAAAGFKLRGWNTNQASVLRDIPAELRATSPTPLGGDGPENKILGLIWNAEQDELGFNTSMNRVPTEVINRTRAPTKREALSAVMSIYDPLGLLSHFTVRAKIVLQSLWRLQISWDEPIPEEENELFAAWLDRLSDLACLRLERCYMLNEAQDLQLHVLCDASEQAYAAVAYWRITRPDGSVRLCLVAAKSKVAPRRTQTIPRLELQAAVIGSRLAATIKREHRVKISKTVYWTDSTTVVHWVRNDGRRYTPFVSHRLGEVAELTHVKEWRWVPTEQNVADDATRIDYSAITASDRWFRGPEFLLQPEDKWPADKTQPIEDCEVLHVCEKSEVYHAWLPDPTRFSNYNRYVRAAAYVLAFIDKCRRQTSQLRTTHIERAENAIISRAQHESFGEDVARLQTARPISKASRLYRLDPILEDGLLRVKGRIGAATAPVEAKKPLILDGRHRITKLIVMREHQAAGHAGRERVTNDLRQRYWIIHLRPTVRTIEQDCGLCKKRRARPQPPATGDLPRERLEPYQRPFTHCGLDYFGPMVVKVGRRREKRWGALFTCLTSRAVHLEIVASLTTSSAIMALRRMAARRGWPRTIYSDNATNFHGADKELKTAYEEWMPALRDLGQLHAVNWRYIPPGAPNQGGAWERLVRSVKTALSATLKEKEPTEEVLGTLLTEAEFSINARPLTHVSVNPEDPEALTPNHFLLGSSMGLPSTGPCQYADRRTWRSCQALADYFWSRWVREYLPTLVPRGEPSSQRRPLQTGDIVVVVDHVLPRNVWPMGEVTRTYTGPDGGIRMADVRTRSGVFKRPVSKLVVLEKAVTQTAALGGELSSTPSHAA